MSEIKSSPLRDLLVGLATIYILGGFYTVRGPISLVFYSLITVPILVGIGLLGVVIHLFIKFICATEAIEVFPN
ncbi:MAG: hypothetical protein WC480_03240 [Patescibacteria group bacterium]